MLQFITELILSYEHKLAGIIKWHTYYIDSFKIKIGVLQEEVWPNWLFSSFINKFIARLEKSGYGHCLYDVFIGYMLCK